MKALALSLVLISSAALAQPALSPSGPSQGVNVPVAPGATAPIAPPAAPANPATPADQPSTAVQPQGGTVLTLRGLGDLTSYGF